MMLEDQMVSITQELLQSLKMSKIFKDHQKDINAIDFSKDSQYLVSCDDQALNVFDVVSGKKIRTLYNKVREIDLVKFTHHSSSIICVTKKEPYEIFYWSLHDNQILKKFVGHTNIIHWLDLSPVSDDFLSCSMDGTLRLWNLTSEQQSCEGLLDLSAKKTFCVAAFDPSGQVFAVVFLEEYYCVSNNWLYLYDFKKYHSGSFQSKKINCSQVKCIKFSNNNKYILCSTGDGSILILDAYKLDTICELSDFSNEGSMIEAGFTPDSNYVFSGSETGTIYIWGLPSGHLITKLEGHQKRCKVVKFSPNFFVMASGCRNLVMWTPDHFPSEINNSRRSLMTFGGKFYGILQQFDELMNSELVIEEITDDLQNDKVDIPKTDTKKIMHTLVLFFFMLKKEENLKEKNEFVQSESYNQFQQILVISQITINFSNDDPFFRHITMVVKTIRKAIKRRLTVDTNYIKSKQEFKMEQANLFKIFYQDISIGFITSTEQIKSTAFIFINKNIQDYLNKKMQIEQQHERVRITLHFYNLNNTQKEPLVKQEFKQQFIRTNKFKNNFIVLNEEQDKQQDCIIYHVYKPMDDQIYLVKRIHLQSIPLNVQFQTIFTLQNTSNPDFLKIQEALILSHISHPNIIRLFDWWFEIRNQKLCLYTQIEYCTYPGYLSQTKNLLSYSYFYMNPLPKEQKCKMIIEIISQVISGLEFLQKQQIVHGDLKPESIMVTKSITGEIQVCLADLNQKYSCFNETPKYRSQSQQEQSIYAIGVLLMHLILTFPGEPTLRNNYVTKFQNYDFEDSLSEFDKWAFKSVKNRNKEFSFFLYKNLMALARSLLQKKQFYELHEVRTYIQNNKSFDPLLV